MKCSATLVPVLGLVLTAVIPISGQSQSDRTSNGQNAVAANASVQPAAGPSIKAHDESFIIGNDDVLAISVWKEPELTKAVPVRSDGKISLPLVGEMQATGRSPLQLEQDITAKLKDFITTPEVTVIVQQVNSRKFNILGEVTKPGSFPLTASTTVMDAIATAGGFRDFAKKSNVYVLRKGPDGSESRLKFNYKEFIKGKDTAQNIRLEPNDTIIVP
ncbi:MAG: polysaccharide biosynthesis/export family protein [Terracidiphilus sp.]